jgi:hypothetical protein
MNKKKNKKKRLIRLSLLRNKMTNIFEKKRFKFLGSFSILLHILAASWVLYAMLYNPKSINNSLNFGRFIFGLDEHEHGVDKIFESWLLSIQLRYIITDCYVFYNALVNHRLLKHTITIHGIEGIVCSFIFFFKYDKDYFIFGVICLIWSFLWFSASRFIDNFTSPIINF